MITVLIIITAALLCAVIALAASVMTQEHELLQEQAQNFRHQRHISELTTSIGHYVRQLDIAKSTLRDLRDQNFGDPSFEIWAHKRAQDALNYMTNIARYGNPTGRTKG